VTIRVVIVDDQPLMRAAFRTILEADGLDVVGEAASGDEAVGVVAANHPDVVIMDVRMPGGDGLTATARLVGHRSDVRVLVLTTFDLDEYLYGALQAGAAGFLLKNASPEDLIRAVRTLAEGGAVLDPAVTGRVMARFAGPGLRAGGGRAGGARAGPPRAATLATLTEREKDVLALLVGGMSNAEIAAALDVGEATAKTHVSRVLAKLGVRDRVQAVIVAYETGFAPTARQPG